MKKYILPLMSIAMFMAMASCSSSDDVVAENNDTEEKLVRMTFTATQESNVGTRAELNSENKVDWQANDKISVFDGTGAENNRTFTISDVESGKFSGTASSSSTKFTAVYPYTSGAQLVSDGSVSGITLPAEQTAKSGSFDPKAALMMAYTTDKSRLDFKNAVSLIKIETKFACKQVVLTAGEVIAGKGTLKYNNDAPSITFDSGQSNTIVLKPSNEGGNIEIGTYYIVVPAITLNSFSISFTASSDYNIYTRKSTQSNTFNRSKIKNFGTFNTTDGTWTQTSRGTVVQADQEVDMGDIFIGGKKYRVIFAKSNLTNDGLASKYYDHGDYFAWGATEPWYESKIINGISVQVNTWKEGYDTGYSDANYNKYLLDKTIEENNKLKKEYDAAYQKLKGDWQIPTQSTWQALYDANGTTVSWGANGNLESNEVEGIEGMKISRKDDPTKYIFLPLVGRFYGELCGKDNEVNAGYYWSSSSSHSQTASNYISIAKNHVNPANNLGPMCGLTIRPVRLVELY